MGVFVVEYTITVHVDNSGEIFLSENTSASQQKNHKDVHHKFICNYVEDGTVKIEFLLPEEYLSYLFNKNLSKRPFHLLTAGCVHHE